MEFVFIGENHPNDFEDWIQCTAPLVVLFTKIKFPSGIIMISCCFHWKIFSCYKYLHERTVEISNPYIPVS